MAGVIGTALSEIVRELSALREQRAIGTYYLVTADNKQVRFGIANGEVVTLSVRASNLSAAFDAIAGLQIVRTRFAEDVLTVGGGTIPLTTDQVYAELLSRSGDGGAVPKPLQQAAESRPAYLAREQQEALRQLLIEYLGPIGDFVFDEHHQASASAEVLIANLAQEIADGRRAEQFIARARSLLPA
jgi:hypothetical protein